MAAAAFTHGLWQCSRCGAGQWAPCCAAGRFLSPPVAFCACPEPKELVWLLPAAATPLSPSAGPDPLAGVAGMDMAACRVVDAVAVAQRVADEAVSSAGKLDRVIQDATGRPTNFEGGRSWRPLVPLARGASLELCGSPDMATTRTGLGEALHGLLGALEPPARGEGGGRDVSVFPPLPSRAACGALLQNATESVVCLVLSHPKAPGSSSSYLRRGAVPKKEADAVFAHWLGLWERGLFWEQKVVDGVKQQRWTSYCSRSGRSYSYGRTTVRSRRGSCVCVCVGACRANP